MDNLSKYDAVLICNIDDAINESYGDDRVYNSGSGYSKTGSKSTYTWYDDPRLYANNAFGKMMLSDLNGWSSGYSAKVSDFGKWVVVEVTYSNNVTGRTASKIYLVVFDGGPKGTSKSDGMVLTTANKWRTISGYGQAVSYIKSSATSLENATSQKI